MNECGQFLSNKHARSFASLVFYFLVIYFGKYQIQCCGAGRGAERTNTHDSQQRPHTHARSNAKIDHLLFNTHSSFCIFISLVGTSAVALVSLRPMRITVNSIFTVVKLSFLTPTLHRRRHG